RAALSAVLLFVAARILRVGSMRRVLRTSPWEFLLILATVAAMIVLPIEQGAGVGVGLSLVRGMWASVSPRSFRMHRVPGTTVWWPDNHDASGERLTGVEVVGFQAPLSFLNADSFRRQLGAALARPGVSLVVLEAAGIIDIDYTGGEAFKAVTRQAKASGVILAVARLEAADAQAAYDKLGVGEAVGRDRLFNSVNEAIASLAPDAQVAPAAA